jgi:hypothetical protein
MPFPHLATHFGNVYHPPCLLTTLRTTFNIVALTISNCKVLHSLNFLLDIIGQNCFGMRLNILLLTYIYYRGGRGKPEE